jgi:hypothetical protein
MKGFRWMRLFRVGDRWKVDDVKFSGVRAGAMVIAVAAICMGAGLGATTRPTTQAGRILQLNADAVNRVRQSLLMPDDPDALFHFQHDVLKRFAASTNRPWKDFGGEPHMQQAMEILRDGDAGERNDVRVLTDPPVIMAFRSTVLPLIVRGCGSRGCHGDTGADDFYVSYRFADTAEVYADFQALRDYVKVTDETKHSMFSHTKKEWMIDVENPEDSLLLRFALPRNDTQRPHPLVKFWRSLALDQNDPRYLELTKWINELRDNVNR